ncbi:multidrug DMT transporter permease [Afipia sp. Root123D2]|uniref:DMT family transporter n=1 Tax=Afipia sp. Root123D2 TaxID=1736436 RepID=UPI0006FB474E|nr:DMT family transporter [Afipia sp. Root123D2]KQW19286.1 multidrug DMT transporter permease [Afipia sp. Root123D2]
MPKNQKTPGARPLDAMAIALMLMLCLSWGFNQISVKVALPDIPPFTQATIRSIGGLLVIMLGAWLRGVKMFERDGTLGAGLFAGVLFGFEFILIYRGLVYTTASRAVVFLYVAPFVVALGSKRFLGEHLTPMQWGGLGLSFAGVALAIGVPQASVDTSVILGDLMIVGGGVLWAGTTLVVKATRLLHAPAEKMLAYQVAVSIPILAAGAWWSGEQITHMPGIVAWGSMIYQTVWIVGTTFLIWLFLVKYYSASKLSAFTFLTPLFGVIGGYFIMHDTLTLAFGGAALLVMAGLFLVNRRQEVAADPLFPVTKT